MTTPEMHNPFATALMSLHATLAAGLGPMADSGPALAAKVAAALVAAGNDGIDKALRPTGRSLQAAAVLVPSRPRAVFAGSGKGAAHTVPLGDILLLARHRQAGRLIGTTAMLLHIVRNAKVPCRIRDEALRHFLGHWPPFRYAAASPLLEGRIRHVEGPHLHLGSRLFCLVSACDVDMPCACQFPQGMPIHCQKNVLAQPTDPEPTGYTCFAHELLYFVTGNAGRSVRDPAPGEVGFDRVVDDLVAETVHRSELPHSGCEVVGSRQAAASLEIGSGAAWLDAGEPGARFTDVWPRCDGAGGITLVVFDMDQR